MKSLQEVDTYLASLNDWRGKELAEYRDFVHQTAPELEEGWKWGVPVYTGKKLVLAMSAFKGHIKINFFYGAMLDDPQQLFNSGLDSKENRSINLAEGESVDKAALKSLIQEALQLDEQS